MNINTLVSEPLTSKTGKLAIALYPNSLTGKNGEKASYYARVLNRSRLSQADIADDIIASGAQENREDIIRIWKLINSAVSCRLADGISVDTGLGLLRPSICGTFSSASSEFDRSRNYITVLYRPGSKLRELMASLTPVIAQGNRVLPEITGARDKTQSDMDRLSPGGFFSITGKNIKVFAAADDPAGSRTVGLYFDNLDVPEKSQRLLPSQIYHNTASLLEGIIPPLEAGRYRIRVATQYCGSMKGRKAVQEDRLEKDFYVAEP